MLITMLIVIILAVIQGLTEFLPVSSSGHLVIFESLLDFRSRGEYQGVVFEVAVHLGTLGAVIFVYRQKVKELLVSLGKVAVFSTGKVGSEGREMVSADIRYILLLIVASIPAGLVGLTLNDRIESTFTEPSIASLLLIVTGVFLLLTRLRRGNNRITYLYALLIGVAQAVAILPGCSRSGWTITTAILLGIGFEEAAEFSFILSVPAILGAVLLQIVGGDIKPSSEFMLPLIVGILVSFASGWLALKLVLGILRRGYFHRFAYYLLPAGIFFFVYFSYIR
ncbi:MAG: hypothetical protein B6D63_03405 [Candidatus Latescibacteria bacterium 4484_7]|nr:MAG: hypothetical protein B6D63_03405 [Candidatus Latescibacteria bacterium 4484_7]